MSTGRDSTRFLTPCQQKSSAARAASAAASRSLQGDIVECNTAYGGSRQETPKHRQTIEDHGFNAIAKVVIMDEFDQIEIPCPPARPT